MEELADGRAFNLALGNCNCLFVPQHHRFYCRCENPEPHRLQRLVVTASSNSGRKCYCALAIFEGQMASGRTARQSRITPNMTNRGLLQMFLIFAHMQSVDLAQAARLLNR